MPELDTKEINNNIGVFIDIDGVVLQGGKPIKQSKESIHVNSQIFYNF